MRCYGKKFTPEFVLFMIAMKTCHGRKYLKIMFYKLKAEKNQKKITIYYVRGNITTL